MIFSARSGCERNFAFQFIVSVLRKEKLNLKKVKEVKIKKIINYVLLGSFILCLGYQDAFYSFQSNENLVSEEKDKKNDGDSPEDDEDEDVKEKHSEQEEQKIVRFEKKFDTSALLVDGND
jgi:hypothetical protein